MTMMTISCFVCYENLMCKDQAFLQCLVTGSDYTSLAGKLMDRTIQPAKLFIIS